MENNKKTSTELRLEALEAKMVNESSEKETKKPFVAEQLPKEPATYTGEKEELKNTKWQFVIPVFYWNGAQRTAVTVAKDKDLCNALIEATDAEGFTVLEQVK